MQVLSLEEKNTERMEAINKFTLMDDTFMTQVFFRRFRMYRRAFENNIKEK